MTGGSSIWIFDFTTKEEHPLVKMRVVNITAVTDG